MKIENVEIEKLKKNPVQPDSRDTKTHGLFGNIQRNGLTVPIIADKERFFIIDGHRRVNCLKKLGYKKVPVIFKKYETYEDMIQAFLDCNADTKKLNRNNYIEVYTKGGSVPANLMRDFIFITDLYGKKTLDKIIAEGLSITILKRYYSFFSLLGLTEKADDVLYMLRMLKPKNVFSWLRLYEKDLLIKKELQNEFKKTFLTADE